MSSARPSSTFHLLLVEDEDAEAELFTELMRELTPDVEVHHVAHGQAALEFLTRQGPHAQAPFPRLIVLDLNMPVMDGHTFLRHAKSHSSVRSIPVLILSTSDGAQDIAQAYYEHASSYMVKPGSFDEYRALIAVIESYWRGTVQLPTVEQLNLT